MPLEKEKKQLIWYFEEDDGLSAEPITKDAYKKAIKCMDALPNITKEIEELAQPMVVGGRVNGKGIRQGLLIALTIVNQYLKEIENEDTAGTNKNRI